MIPMGNENQKLAAPPSGLLKTPEEQEVLSAAEHYFAAKCQLACGIADSDDPDSADDAFHELINAEMDLCNAVRRWNVARVEPSGE